MCTVVVHHSTLSLINPMSAKRRLVELPTSSDGGEHTAGYVPHASSTVIASATALSQPTIESVATREVSSNADTAAMAVVVPKRGEGVVEVVHRRCRL